MDAAAKVGRDPVNKHQIHPEYHGDDTQGDAGRDYHRTRFARPNPQARTGTGEYSFSLSVQLTTSRIGNLTRLIHTLAIYDNHTLLTSSS